VIVIDDVVLGLEQQPQAFADDRVVVRDHDRQRLCCRRPLIERGGDLIHAYGPFAKYVCPVWRTIVL
jgi:hypothetical protein